jgi:hypothetical protein
MRRHVPRLIAAALAIVACVLYPFAPGGHDALAPALPLIAQIAGTFGLVVVLPAALWLVAEILHRRASRGAAPSGGDWRFRWALVTVGLSLPAAFIMFVIAASTTGLVLGIVVSAAWAWMAARVMARSWAARRAAAAAVRPAPIYFIVLPIAAAAATFLLAPPAAELSRARAMDNAAPLIEAIEAYRTTYGRYPLSILAAWPDFKPGVVGVGQYHYEPSGEAYNLYFLYFRHLADRFGTEEFVMYNPRDEHVMTSHAVTRLTSSPEQLAAGGGSYTVVDAGRPHWKRFWFD